MNGFISKTLFSFFFILSLSAPTLAAEANAVDTIAAAQAQSNEDPANKIIQSMKGCNLAKDVEKKAKFFEGDESTTPAECNENIHENYSEVDAIVRIVLHSPSIITVVLAIIIALAFKKVEILAGRPTSYSRYIILLAITLLLTVPWYSSTTKNGNTSYSSTIEMITMVVFKVSSDDVNKRITEMMNNRLFYFSTVRLPDYKGLTSQFEQILDYFILTNGVEDKKPLTIYFADKEGDLVGSIVSGKYVGSLTLPIDENCVNLSKTYGLADCRQYQVDWYKKNVDDILKRLNTAKNSYLVGFKNASNTFPKTFDMKMSCTNIENLDVSVYSERDINGLYLKKVATCLSEDFTYKMHKLKNITTEEYLNNQNFLKSRRVSLCAHDASGTFKYTGYTRTDALAKVKTCVSEACGSQGSPYMCSAAVATFHSLQDKQSFYWHRVPAYLIGDVGVNLTYNAEKFGRRFMFDYEDAGSDTAINNNAQSAFTLSYPKLQSYEAAEYGYVASLFNWMGDQWQYYTGIAMDYNIDQLNALGNIGQDGWFGINKLSTCLAHPYRYVDGYLCGGAIQEVMSNGATNLKGGFDMLVASTSSIGKMKGVKNSTSAEIAQSNNFIQKVVPIKYAGIIGYFFATSSENNLYTSNAGGLETTATNAGIFLASAIGGKEITSLIRVIAYMKIGFGFLFYFVLPFMLLFRFLKSIAELLLHFGLSLTLAMLSYVEAPLTSGSMSNNFSRRENDVPDFIITVFLIISFPLSLLFAYYFTGFFMNNMFSAYPVSIMEMANFLTSGSMSQGSAIASYGTNTLNYAVSGLIIYAHFTFYFAVINLIPMIQGWLLFGNGKFSLDNESDGDFNRYMSKF